MIKRLKKMRITRTDLSKSYSINKEKQTPTKPGP
jgi:hypothetical protein